MLEMFASFDANNVIAGDYPSRAIEIVVPFVAGSGEDTKVKSLARLVAQSLGQEVIIKNLPDPGANSAVRYVMRSKADGYVVVLQVDLRDGERYRVSGPRFMPNGVVQLLEDQFARCNRDLSASGRNEV